MALWAVLVNNGFNYEWEEELEAETAFQARTKFKQRGDWKAKDFKVTKIIIPKNYSTANSE